MKYYYISNNNQQEGPFTLEELKKCQITKNTLVWTEGQENWLKAHHVPEIEKLIIPTPPPLPNSTNKTEKNGNNAESSPTRYDENYEKEVFATMIGITLFIVQIIIISSGSIQSESVYNAIISISAILRLVITIWVVKIAKRQNRSQLGWGIFAVLLPLIALIIISFLKKKLTLVRQDSRNLDETQTPHLQSISNDSISVNGFSVQLNETQPSKDILDALGLDTRTLKHTLEDTNRYIKLYRSKEYPFYAALELDRRDEKLTTVQKDNLQTVVDRYFEEEDIHEVLEKLKSGARQN